VKAITLDATYVESVKGRIFVTFWRPDAAPRHCVMIVPPFAEELNKSRRMLAEVAQLLAARGVATVCPDLFGTGDSEGDFVEADWVTWRHDLHQAATWSAREIAPVAALLAVRLGAELAADASERGQLPVVARTVLWQPVFDRNRHFTQFLRLRTAAMLTQEDRRESTDDLKKQLLDGQSLAIAGYELNPALARELATTEQRRLLPAAWGQISWMEIQRDSSAPLPPPSARMIEASSVQGAQVEPWTTTGEPFWSSTEIVRNLTLINRTAEVLA
jgi:exosortase A-associated hydrolase 2